MTGPDHARTRLDLLWPGLLLALACAVQLAVPYPVDDDTAYHAAVGRLIRAHGILHEFPWTPFSTQFTHYADKEFLFHLLFVPLAGVPFVTAARIVGTLCGGAVLAALYFVLRRERVAWAGLWALVPLASSAFLFRFALVRPHLLSIVLAVLLTWALAGNRTAITASIGFLYPLCYVAFWQVPLILVACVAAAALVARKPVPLRSIGTLGCGIVAGVVVHPNTRNLLSINWIHFADVLVRHAWAHSGAVAVGTELSPPTPGDWARFLVLASLEAVAAALLAWRARRDGRVTPAAFAAAALAFGVITARSNRFLEYFVPLAAVACALACRDLRKRWIAPAVLAASIAYAGLAGTGLLGILFSRDTKTGIVDAPVAAALAAAIPQDARVFTTGWDFTGNLMLALPGRRFMVAADPTLFYRYDPELFRLWSTLPTAPPHDVAGVIRTAFRSRFVVARNYEAYLPLFDALRADACTRVLHADERWVVYDLAAAGGCGVSAGR